MLNKHFGAVEDHLLYISRIPENSGHPLHKGTPRESFVAEFLQNHLSERLSIGTGEIIDSNSKPGENRNQIDVVLYRSDYPRIDFGGGINAFLAESVVATIEVKSNLTKDKFTRSLESAANVKKLKRNLVPVFHSGYRPPSILSYIVAYDGPKRIKTVYKWIINAHDELQIPDFDLPLDVSQRIETPSPSIDGIFILGNGFVYLDNVPMNLGSTIGELRQSHPRIKWAMTNQPRGNLLLLFLFLTLSVRGIAFEILDPYPYLKSFNIKPIMYGE